MAPHPTLSEALKEAGLVALGRADPPAAAAPVVGSTGMTRSPRTHSSGPIALVGCVPLKAAGGARRLAVRGRRRRRGVGATRAGSRRVLGGARARRRPRGSASSSGARLRRRTPRGRASADRTAPTSAHGDAGAAPGRREPRPVGRRDRRSIRPALDGLVPYEPGKPVEEVQRELGLERVVKLASNEGPYGPFPAALEAIERALRSSSNRYPDGGCYRLRERARRAARRRASRR